MLLGRGSARGRRRTCRMRSTPDAGHHRFLDHGFAVGALEDLAADAGVLAFGVLPHDVEVDVAGYRPASGLGTPGSSLTGRRLTYWSKCAAELQQAAPQRDVVGHDLGPADGAEEDRVEPRSVSSNQSAGSISPCPEVVVGAGEVELGRSPGRSRTPRRRPRRTRRPSGTTSLPIPSPGMTAMRCVAPMRKCSCSRLAGSCLGRSPLVMGVVIRDRVCLVTQ